jgi:3-isopropylmalate dehydrogenase
VSEIAVIKGDGIGIEVTEAAIAIIETACGSLSLKFRNIAAGADYYRQTGRDIEIDGEESVGECDAILLGAIGLPSIRYADGTEISHDFLL